MILILYNLALVLALLVSAPWWLWRLATTRKYREGLFERLGRVPPRPALAKRPVVWIHAVSVGEVLAITRLVAALEETMPGFQVAISTTTRTGQALARERFGAGRVFYSPLDLPWAVHAHLEALQPRMLVLAETEFWPNLLSGCFRRRIPVVVVNARISDRSWPRYKQLRRLWSPFLSRLTRVLAQTEKDAMRLSELGCAPPALTVSGNLKFDVRITQEAEATRLLRQRSAGLRLIVAGSTLPGEEEELLAAWPTLLQADPKLALVIAPRHPERFASVAALLSGFNWRRRSEMAADAASLAPGEIVLLDSIGELASVYSLAAVAFVGGSLVPAGGHNPLEPAQFGVPVVMGEHSANFQAIVQALLSQQAMLVTTPARLSADIAALLRDPARAAAMGDRGRQLFLAQAGATDRTVSVIAEVLARQVEPPQVNPGQGEF
jgi:3-deoxy-D-manno-octulosonic-acid transferase